MKRYMISPYQFGSSTQLAWEENDSPTKYAHTDYCNGYRDDWSVRLWEPGREALSTPGFEDEGALGDRGPELPARTTVHGVKGEVRIWMGWHDRDIGTWYELDGETPLDPQPTAADTWRALGEVRYTSSSGAVTEEMMYAARSNGLMYCPFFVALYRGTYKAVDADAGWEIDSGPADDVATLLSLDITNPSVLEDTRMDWWDLEYVPFTVASTTGAVYDTQAEIGFSLIGAPAGAHRGSFHKYAINLEANKVLSPSQVLWLHFKTGVIQTEVYQDTATGTEPVCAMYAHHAFYTAIHGSMMITRKVIV